MNVRSLVLMLALVLIGSYAFAADPISTPVKAIDVATGVADQAQMKMDQAQVIMDQAQMGTAQPQVTEDVDPQEKMPRNVGNKICPVSGEKIDGAMGETGEYEYKGKIYNLCCKMCLKDFKKDPEKYSKIAEDEVAKAASEAPQGDAMDSMDQEKK